MPLPTPLSSSTDLADLHLGDVLEFISDRRQLTVRAAAVFPRTYGGLRGFVLTGEFEAVLAVPAQPSPSVELMLPTPADDAAELPATRLTDGVCRYWAPNKVAVRSMMGELPFHVLELPGAALPAVALQRAAEEVVFTRTAQVPADDISVLAMPRDQEDLGEGITQQATVVRPSQQAADVHPSELAEQLNKNLAERMLR